MNFILKLPGLHTVDTILSRFSRTIDELNYLKEVSIIKFGQNNERIETLRDENIVLKKEADRAEDVANRISSLLGR